MGRFTRPVMPLLLRSRAMRRSGLRDVAVDGARLSPARVLEMSDDMLGCDVADAIFDTHDHFAPLDPLPCPVTIAWSERDRIFPERASGARYVVLDGVGHVPMFDDPALVARTIARSVAAAR
jgi:pimeloyl-ACP methyl ester carboxylesterase